MDSLGLVSLSRTVTREVSPGSGVSRGFAGAFVGRRPLSGV